MALTPATKKWILYGLVFLGALLILGLTSWKMVQGPSPHFHFIDQAQTMLEGRADTLTPFRKAKQKELPDDPPGLQEAINRHLELGGWNDWVSYYVIVLEDGQIHKGVWPWKGRKPKEKGFDLRSRFVTLNGDWLELNPDKTDYVAQACLDRPTLAPGSIERAQWDQRDRFDAEMQACLEWSQQKLADPETKTQCDPRTQNRVSCRLKRNFVSFPPGPAVAMIPFVALFDYNLNDVVFTLLFAALNALLLFVVLRKFRELGYFNHSNALLLWIVAAFALGTVNYFVSIRGEVWFTALVMGVTFNLLYILFSTHLAHPLLAGVALAAGYATRTPLAFGVAYFGLQWIFQKVAWDKAGLVFRLKQGVLFGAPIVVTGVLLMMYNYARFENPGEFGHRFLLEGTRSSIVDHGLFSYHFLAHNLKVAFTNLPEILQQFPWVKISGHGLAIWVTSPFLLYLVWPKKAAVDEHSKQTLSLSIHTILWITVACIAVPGFLYQNSGWFQFGYRFIMDYLPFLMVLLALDGRKRGPLFYGLVIVGILVNLFGAVTFIRFPEFYN